MCSAMVINQIILFFFRWLSENATIFSAILVSKRLLKHGSANVQYAPLVLELMMSNQFISNEKFDKLCCK